MSVADDFLDWFGDHCLAWIVIFIMLFAGLFIVGAIYAAINPAPPEKGFVSEKQHYEAYSNYVMTGKVTVPIYHPERWVVVVNGKRACEVQEPDWNNVQLGQEFICQ